MTDLVERTRKLMERQSEKNGPDSASVKMLKELMEQLENPKSAQETFMER